MSWLKDTDGRVHDLDEPDPDAGTRARMTVELPATASARALLHGGGQPGLLISTGRDELVLLAGPRWQDAGAGKEFALHLISAAVGFADMCNHRLRAHSAWPADDPETEDDELG